LYRLKEWFKSKFIVNCTGSKSDFWIKYKQKRKIKQKDTKQRSLRENETLSWWKIRVITRLPNSEQSYKGKVKTHNYINRQNQSTTGKLWKRNDRLTLTSPLYTKLTLTSPLYTKLTLTSPLYTKLTLTSPLYLVEFVNRVGWHHTKFKKLILCCVFILFFFVLCTLCCQFLWNVYFW
jgi:hypothetical protein